MPAERMFASKVSIILSIYHMIYYIFLEDVIESSYADIRKEASKARFTTKNNLYARILSHSKSLSPVYF
jgi:hypothetical protein